MLELPFSQAIVANMAPNMKNLTFPLHLMQYDHRSGDTVVGLWTLVLCVYECPSNGGRLFFGLCLSLFSFIKEPHGWTMKPVVGTPRIAKVAIEAAGFTDVAPLGASGWLDWTLERLARAKEVSLAGDGQTGGLVALTKEQGVVGLGQLP